MSHTPESVRAALRVAPGTVILAGYDTGATARAPGKRRITRTATSALAAPLATLQEKLFAEGTRSVLLVLQGIDTAGKGGVVNHVVSAFGPEGVRTTAFKQPTAEEAAHHFLWRIRKQLPPPGIIAVFDRSHYEDVIVPRVHETLPEEQWRARYAQINAFEADLVANGTTVLKCFLHISYETQRERLLARLADPRKRWKFHESDIDERAYWADYQAAYAGMLEHCSTDAAPWYVIPSDHKWYRNWAVGELMLEALRDLDPRYPDGGLDIPRLRQRLHPPY